MARIYVPGLSAHLIRRGVNRCTIFGDDEDRTTFLVIVKEAARDGRTKFHAIALMSTHYHGLVTPADRDALPHTMKMIGERYVEYFNRKYGRVGTLWSGRYRAIYIDSERYLLNCLRYIEQNPVRARMVAAPGDYRWSSYRVHAFGERSDWLTPHPVYRALGATQKERQAAYRSACEVPLTEDELALQRRPPRGRVRARTDPPAPRRTIVPGTEPHLQVTP